MKRHALDLTYFVGDWKANPTNERHLVYKHHYLEKNMPALQHGAVVEAAVKYMSTAKVRTVSLAVPR